MSKIASRNVAKLRITGEMDQWFVSVGLMAVVLGILVLAISIY